MYSIKITKAEKLHVQSDGSTILAVDFDVLNDGVLEVSYSHGFALATTKDDLNVYLKDFLSNYSANKARGAANAEQDAELAVADKTASEVVGIEITS